MDKISEQVKELRNLSSGKEHYCDWKKSEIIKQAANTIETLYENLKNSRWILCSDRLPTKEESIKNDNRFILDDGNGRYGGLFDYEKQCFVRFDFWRGLVEDKCVIAWQPLPEPYTKNHQD